MAGASRLHWPRRGSMQFWPRVRAKRIYPRIRTWVANQNQKLLGFLGYKAGMTHLFFESTDPHAPMKGKPEFMPVTIVECPPMKPYSIRFYRHSTDGLLLASELFSPKLDAKLFKIPKKSGQRPAQFDSVRLVVYSQPSLTGTGKKNPELIEIGIGGKTPDEQCALAQSLLDKEIKVSDVFKQPQFVDIHGVTKAKGFQGTVKRFGVKIRQHKSEKTKRGVGTLGPWTQKRVLYTVAQAGKMGYHTRTEYNKFLLKVGAPTDAITPKGGFVRYGNVKNDYIILKGSIPGPKKRTVLLTEPRRPVKPLQGSITSISLTSQQ